jgi:MFS superfamily sulfate permease-like transporter
MAIGPLGPYPGWLAPALAVATGALILALAKSARWPAGLVTIAGGAVLGLLLFGAPRLGFGPVAPRLVLPAGDDFWTATVLLVLPQLPLTLANSITATRDVARAYFGAEAARRVTGRALTVGLGAANLVAGAAGGMPVCHGSGGMTAHVRLGARSGGSGILIGALLLAAAVGCGPGIAALAGVIPRPVLGAHLIYVGVAHGMLVRDVRGASDWTVVAATGVVGGATLHNGYGLLAGIVMLAAGAAARRWRAARKGRAARGAA